MNNEIWKDIPEYEGLYQVSDFGRVKSLERVVLDKPGIYKTIKERILKSGIGTNGYSFVILSKLGKHKHMTVHKLMAMCFLNHNSTSIYIVVNHINFIRTDNRLCNLEIVTSRENANRKHITHSSKYTGVSWSNPHNKWRADIYINKKFTYLGLFENEYEAHLKYESELKYYMD